MTTPLHAMAASQRLLGALLREWRQRRKLSQLALALAANVSQRHLSFVESGRTQPSREMVLRLTTRLELPLRERNRLLLAAGFAPLYPERPLDDPALGAARGDRARADGPRALPGARHRPPLDAGGGEPRGGPARRRRVAAAARAAGNRASTQPAPRRYGAAHRELRAVAHAPPRAAAPAGRGERG